MASLRFVHSADIHLDSPLRGLDQYDGAPSERFRAATRRALENLVRLCLDLAADFLLIAGDLYDGNWRDYRTGLFFAAQMAELRAAGIPVFLIRGNHDAQSEITRHLRLPENVHSFASDRPESDLATLAHLGIAVHGQSFATRAVSDDLARGYPDRIPDRFNIGLLHTALDGREGHDRYAPTSLAVLEDKGYDYWALGHVHRREVVRKEPWVVFPGNLQGRHVRETGARGATVVTVEDGRVTSVEARALDVVRWAVCEVPLEEVNSGDGAVDLARAALEAAVAAADGRPLAARVILRGATAAHAELAAGRERWTAEVRSVANDLGEARVWIERIEIASRGAIDLAKLAGRDDAMGALLRSIDELRRDPEARGELATAFAELKRKLPRELREGPDALAFDDPLLLDAIEQLLLPRLLERGEEP